MLAEQEEKTALTLPERAQVALSTVEHEKKLLALVAASADIKEIKNADGRVQVHTAYMGLKNWRVAIEKTGKEAREDATAFSKAVIAEEKRLIAIIDTEEARLQTLRDAWDEEVERQKQAKIAAERARVDGIQKDIAGIRNMAITAVGKPVEVLSATLEVLDEIEFTEERFAEFVPDAARAVGETMEAVTQLYHQAIAAKAEQERLEAERAAEAQRLAEEAARMKLEREELARQRAEQDRIAAENAKVAKEAEAERQRQHAAAQAELKAAQDKMEAEAASLAKAQEALQESLRQQFAQLEAEKAAIAQQKADEEAAKELAAAKQSESGVALSHSAQELLEAEGTKRFAGLHKIAALVVNAPSEHPAFPLELDAKTAADAEVDEGKNLLADNEILSVCAAALNVPVFIAAKWLSEIDYSEWM